MDELATASKIDLKFSEHKVIFTICDCSLDKKYSFWKLSKEQAEKFITRLKHLEKMTWRQLSGLDRKHGLTVENPASESFAMIDGQNTSETKIVEQYYFHLRIETDGVFRLFGYQRERFFCITHLDPTGSIHH